MTAKVKILVEGYTNADSVAETEEENPEKSRYGDKDLPVCKKCRRPVRNGDRCACRPRLCFRCCECGLDCDACSCSHKKRNR